MPIDDPERDEAAERVGGEYDGLVARASSANGRGDEVCMVLRAVVAPDAD